MEYSETRNGWTKYETKLIDVWLRTDEARLQHCHELANESLEVAAGGESYTSGISDIQRSARFELADRLRAMIDRQNPLNDDSSVYADLLNAGIAEVDWHEIAESFLDECQADD